MHTEKIEKEIVMKKRAVADDAPESTIKEFKQKPKEKMKIQEDKAPEKKKKKSLFFPFAKAED